MRFGGSHLVTRVEFNMGPESYRGSRLLLMTWSSRWAQLRREFLRATYRTSEDLQIEDPLQQRRIVIYGEIEKRGTHSRSTIQIFEHNNHHHEVCRRPRPYRLRRRLRPCPDRQGLHQAQCLRGRARRPASSWILRSSRYAERRLLPGAIRPPAIR